MAIPARHAMLMHLLMGSLPPPMPMPPPVAPLEFQRPVLERSGRRNDQVGAMGNGTCWPGFRLM
jgi:hypothetical protein